MSDKRAQFFFLAAVICFVLAPLAQDQFRAITLGVAVTYVILGLASALDYRSRHRD